MSLLGFAGGLIQGAMNRDFQREQNRWNLQVANTAFQRGMQDMKLAGLNPILAYRQGGAPSPVSSGQGQGPIETDLTSEIGNVSNAMTQREQRKNMGSQRELMGAQGESARAAAGHARQQTAEAAARTTVAAENARTLKIQNDLREKYPRLQMIEQFGTPIGAALGGLGAGALFRAVPRGTARGAARSQGVRPPPPPPKPTPPGRVPPPPPPHIQRHNPKFNPNRAPIGPPIDRHYNLDPYFDGR